MAGTFYGIGVGPGDPELLTMKAIKAIENADVLIAPKTEKKDVFEKRHRNCLSGISDGCKL